MRTRLLSLLLVACLAGELATPALGQSGRPRAEPQAQFDDDFDDQPVYRPQYSPRGNEAIEEEGVSMVWLFVIIGLSLLGGGGWYWWDDLFESGGLMD
jgi:hypothetical protein